MFYKLGMLFSPGCIFSIIVSNPLLVPLEYIVCSVGKQYCDCRHTTPIFNDSYKDYTVKKIVEDPFADSHLV